MARRIRYSLGSVNGMLLVGTQVIFVPETKPLSEPELMFSGIHMKVRAREELMDSTRKHMVGIHNFKLLPQLSVTN